MPLTIAFWSYNKRLNSTKAPAVDSFKSKFLCTLKDDTNILHPVIKIQNRSDEEWNPHDLNYAYMQAFNRFYHVDNWSYNRGLWECSLSVDVLASWKDSIRANKFYILRSERNSNDLIMDTAYPTMASAETAVRSAENAPWTSNLESGTYIVGILNNDNATLGAVSYYSMTNANMRSLCNRLFNSPNWLNISTEEISNELVKSLFNPFQYISSVMFFPFGSGKFTIDSTTTTLPVGWWSFENFVTSKVTSLIYEETFRIEVPKHPDFQKFGSFVRQEPYSFYSLYFPGFGDIPLDGSVMGHETTLDFTVRVDGVTGKAMLYSKNASGDVCEHHVGQIGIPIQIAQASVDVLGTAVNAVSAVGGAVSSLFQLDVGGAISNTVSGIANTVKSAMPQLKTSGANGSIVEIGIKPQIRAKFYRVVEPMHEVFGRPCCIYSDLLNLTGFVQVTKPCVDFPGYASEKETANIYLSEGLYIE